jgi:hypothetical protein
MGSEAENSELAWLTTLFADEGALRQIFARQPELVKELLRNKGFLDMLFDAKRGALAMLLATPAEETGDIDTLIGMVVAGDD